MSAFGKSVNLSISFQVVKWEDLSDLEKAVSEFFYYLDRAIEVKEYNYYFVEYFYENRDLCLNEYRKIVGFAPFWYRGEKRVAWLKKTLYGRYKPFMASEQLLMERMNQAELYLLPMIQKKRAVADALLVELGKHGTMYRSDLLKLPVEGVDKVQLENTYRMLLRQSRITETKDGRRYVSSMP